MSSEIVVAGLGAGGAGGKLVYDYRGMVACMVYWLDAN